MQDQETNQAPAVNVSAAFLEQLAAADVVVLISSSESNDTELGMRIVVPGVAFNPEHILSHAYAHAISGEHPNLLRQALGLPTEAARYRALRAFAELAGKDPVRFEVVNSALQQFEEAENLADEKARTGEDSDKIADFIMHMLIETEPVPVAPTAEPEHLEAPAPRIILAS